jgi:Ca2+-binding EF-hand superfamily protein
MFWLDILSHARSEGDEGKEISLFAIDLPHLTVHLSATELSDISLLKESLAACKKGIFNRLLSEASELIDLRAFLSIMTPYLQHSVVPALHLILGGLFDKLDRNSSGYVCLRELVCALNLLSPPSRSEKIAFAFLIFDFKSVDLVSETELTQFCYVVMATACLSSRVPRDTLIPQLVLAAHEKASMLMARAHVNSEGLNFQEFCSHLNELEVHFPFASVIDTVIPNFSDQGPTDMTKERERVVEVNHCYNIHLRHPDGDDVVVVLPEDLHDLALLRNGAGLAGISTAKLLSAFDQYSQNGSLSHATFLPCIESLIDSKPLCADDKKRLDAIIQRFFVSFDVDGDGSVDFKELFFGMSLLCSGSKLEKLQLCRLLDRDGNGVISKQELQYFLRSIMCMMFALNREAMSLTPAELDKLVHKHTSHLADCCFRAGDIDHDGSLSSEEFSLMLVKFPDLVGFISFMFSVVELSDCVDRESYDVFDFR